MRHCNISRGEGQSAPSINYSSTNALVVSLHKTILVSRCYQILTILYEYLQHVLFTFAVF
jgi:hypothetical protein